MRITGDVSFHRACDEAVVISCADFPSTTVL